MIDLVIMQLGRIPAESIVVQTDFNGIFTTGFGIPRDSNPLLARRLFDTVLKENIVSLESIFLRGKQYYLHILKKFWNDNGKNIFHKVPYNVKHSGRIYGGELHSILGLFVTAWLLDYGYKVSSECNVNGSIVDLISNDYEWAIEIGETSFCPLLEHLEDPCTYVGVLPFQSYDEPLILFVFHRGKQWELLSKAKEEMERKYGYTRQC